MANRVNVKFVVGLIAVVVVFAGGVVAVSAFLQRGSGEYNIERGDEAMAAGDYEEALSLYGKAVYNDRQNDAWLEKLLDATGHLAPESASRYQEKFFNDYRGTIRQLAINNARDVSRQLDLLGHVEEASRGPMASPQGLRMLAELAAERSAFFEDPAQLAQLVRYRGMAYSELSQTEETKPEDIEQAEADLRLTIEQIPDDEEAVIALALLLDVKAERALEQGQVKNANQMRDEADALLDAKAAEYQTPALYLTQLSRKTQRMLTEAAGQIDARRAGVEALQPLTQKTIASLEAAAPETLSWRSLTIAPALLPALSSSDTLNDLLPVLDAAATTEPYQLNKRLLHASMLSRMSKHEEVIAALQEIVEAPLPPLSVRGLMLPGLQVQAYSLQLDSAISLWASDRENATYAERVGTLRSELADRVDVSTRPALDLADARVALIEGDLNQAIELYSKLRSGNGARDPQVLIPLADALRRRGDLGSAGETFQQAIEISPNRPGAYIGLADVYRQLGDLEKGMRILESASVMFPTNEALKQSLAQLRLIESAGIEDFTTVAETNPEAATILEAQQLLRDEDASGARQLIIDRYGDAPTGANLALLQALARLDVQLGERDTAIARVEQALEELPGNTQIENMLIELRADSPLDAALQIIANNEEMSDIDRIVQRYRVFLSAGEREQASTELQKAIELDGDNPRVLELSYDDAVARQDLQAATEIAQRAATTNADRLNGRLYEGRVALLRGQMENNIDEIRRARDLFRETTVLIPEAPTNWYLLGIASSTLGEAAQAVDAFARAYEGRPTDLLIVKAYAASLQGAARGPEALEVVQVPQVVQMTPGTDVELISLWLQLEELYGDADNAVLRRAELMESGAFPPASATYNQNLVRIVQNLATSGRVSEAYELLDRQAERPGVDLLTLASLRARTALAQGEPTAGEQTLRDYIASLGEEQKTYRALSVLADYLVSANQTESALAVFEEGKAYQSDERREADHAQGLYLLQLGNTALAAARQVEQGSPEAEAQTQRANAYLEQAILAYTDALQATASTNAKLQLARTYGSLSQHEQAIELTNEILQETPQNIEAALLAVASYQQQGDTEAALRAADNAVRTNPQEQRTFIARALLLRSQARQATETEAEQFWNDVVADLENALAINESSLQTWALIFEALLELERVDDAFNRLRTASLANPNSAELRLFLIEQLRSYGRLGQALAEASDAADQFPQDPQWNVIAAQVAAQNESPAQAASFYQKAFEINPSNQNASLWLQAALESNRLPPPRLRRQLMRQLDDFRLETPELADKVAANIILARAYFTLDDTREGDRRIQDAFEDSLGSPVALRVWANQTDDAYAGDHDRMLAVVDRLSDTRPKPVLLHLIRAELNQGLGASAAIAKVEELNVTEEDDRQVRFEAFRLLNDAQFAAGNYEKAVEFGRKALGLNQFDPELNNNVAYTIAKHLGDPEAGKPYSVQAMASMGNRENAAIIDTAAWIEIQLGNTDRALSLLTRALLVAENDEQRIAVYTHTGQAKLALGDKIGARVALREAELLLREVNPLFKALFEAEIRAGLEELK